jgi:hypothetical protein
MKKSKLFLTGILAITLVFGTILLGCPDDTTEEKDTWSAVKSLTQLNGTWKGSYSDTMTIKESMEENGIEWDSSMETMLGDIRVTISAEITMTINASAKTQTTSTSATMTFSGGNIGTVWAMISDGYSGQSGVTVDNAKHSITMTETQPAEPISDGDIAEMLAAVQINQNGTKVKVPSGTIGEGSPEIVFIKQ